MRIKILMFFFCSSIGIFAQKSMSLRQCEEAFRNNNLQLLAEQYNISQADADIIQAKIWDLPQISFTGNAYNPEDKRIIDIRHSKDVEIQQLFVLGGKRKKEVEFAKTNKELAQLQYNQLLIDLRSQIRQTYYSLYYDGRKILRIDNQLSFLNDLLKAYKTQTTKGNISLKDEVRLQTLVLGLNRDKTEVTNSILASQNALRILTGINENILPDLSVEEAKDLLDDVPLISLNDLQKRAEQNNAEYQFALKTIESSKAYYNWQKSLNTPDLTAGLQYSQLGGSFKNELNFTIGIPIPLWKQNKGNIQKAQFISEQSQKNAEFKKNELYNQVALAYQTWENQYNQLMSITPKDLDNLEAVYKGMQDNFRKGNVSLIEFTDFSDSYNESVLQMNEMKKQIMISAEELNRLTQTQIFK